MALILGAVAGCGGSDEPAATEIAGPRDPAVWVADFCDNLNVFIDEVATIVEARDAAAASTPLEDLGAVRANVTAYFEGWKNSADGLVDRLGRIGYPDLPDGEAALQILRGEYAKASPAASDALAAVAALPADDPSAFWTELERIEDAFGEAVHIGEVSYPAALAEVFDAEPGCAGWGL